MSKKLFLQGPSTLGKSFSIRQNLSFVKGKIGGFMVKRVLKEGIPQGFALYPPLIELGEEIELQNLDREMFLLKTEKGMIFNPELFSQQLESSLQEGDLLVLDEIGGAELSLPRVGDLLKEVLNGPIPVIGVWKSKANAKRLKERGNLKEDFFSKHQDLEKILQADHFLLDFKPEENYILPYLQIMGLYKELPGRDFCLNLLKDAPTQIQAHSFAVARLVGPLARSFGLTNPESLIQGALLHDLKRKEKNHAFVMAQELEVLGYSSLASLVRHHMLLPKEFYQKEESLLWLADKCCLEDQFIHPQERFAKSLKDYGLTETLDANIKALASFNLPEDWHPNILVTEGGHYENYIFNFKGDSSKQ